MIIIPVNFLCSIRKNDVCLRRMFLNVYSILHINIFQEPVFDDTDYSVCSLQFIRKKTQHETHVHLYPSNAHFTYSFAEENRFMIGGELYTLPMTPSIQVSRVTKYNKKTEYMTNVLLKCIDDSEKSRLGLSLVADSERYIDETEHSTARSYATLLLNEPLSTHHQKELVNRFNAFIQENRKKYHSLFLTNYRENQRKRISFEFAFQICNYLLNQIRNDVH